MYVLCLLKNTIVSNHTLILQFIPQSCGCVFTGNIPGMFAESDTDCIGINTVVTMYVVD